MELKGEIPLNKSEMGDRVYGGSMIYSGLQPPLVEAVNQMVREAAAFAIRQSKERCTERCKTYKEQIMMKAWHPSRVERLLEMGYDPEDM
jgi:hypothetical protein